VTKRFLSLRSETYVCVDFLKMKNGEQKQNVKYIEERKMKI
jgi:hypothetical protein